MEPKDIESNNSICKDGALEDEFYHNNLLWTNGILLVCVATFGILLNATSLYIIQGKKIKETIFNTLAIFLAIIDILLLLNIIYTSIAVHLSTPSLILCQFNLSEFLCYNYIPKSSYVNAMFLLHECVDGLREIQLYRKSF